MKTTFQSIDRFYKSLKLQTKLTITHLVIATIPMIVLAAFFSTKLYDMIVADSIRTEQGASAQTVPLIEGTISQILNVQTQITGQDFYKLTLSADRTEPLSFLAASRSADDFQKKVERVTDGSLVTDVKIYMDVPQDDPAFSEYPVSDTLLPIKQAYGTYWYGIFKGDPTLTKMFCPPFYLSSYEIKHNGDMAYITKSSMLYNGEHVPCFLAIYFSQEHFNALLKDNMASGSSVAYMVNARDNLVATTDSALSGTYHFSYDEIQEYFRSSNNFILKNVLGEDVYAGFYNIKNTDWYMVVAMPSQPIINKSIEITIAFIFVYIACIVVAFLIATLLSSSITKQLSAVINQMAKARTGPPVALPAPDTQDEIGDLISTYNYMTRVINQLMEEQAKSAEDLRIAEFNSLQSQINPHFLYNTMDMINWLSQQGRSQEVTSAIQKLSRFYKLTLSRKKSLSTIANEIEHVSIYVQLQNMRFHDKIDFLIDVPDYLMEHAIPKLTFQPVIENCILHGILEKESKQGTIVLTGWLEENTVVILISDDGIGMSREKIEDMLNGRGTSSVSGSNIGIYNTHRRLQLMYGLQYGLTYNSVPGRGTEVEIRLPASTPSKYTDKTAKENDAENSLRESHLVQALNLLSRPEINLYEIAEECGYKDLQQFFTEFKEHFGYSPEEYRRHVL
ncbi:histidine kinase [Muricomes intestini]|uniref:histidine kinase n=1 Tax=Muricomes intestini TaxID=1796634 RepID=UPI002FE151AF